MQKKEKYRRIKKTNEEKAKGKKKSRYKKAAGEIEPGGKNKRREKVGIIF